MVLHTSHASFRHKIHFMLPIYFLVRAYLENLSFRERTDSKALLYKCIVENDSARFQLNPFTFQPVLFHWSISQQRGSSYYSWINCFDQDQKIWLNNKKGGWSWGYQLGIGHPPLVLVFNSFQLQKVWNTFEDSFVFKSLTGSVVWPHLTIIGHRCQEHPYLFVRQSWSTCFKLSEIRSVWLHR